MSAFAFLCVRVLVCVSVYVGVCVFVCVCVCVCINDTSEELGGRDPHNMGWGSSDVVGFP